MEKNKETRARFILKTVYHIGALFTFPALLIAIFFFRLFFPVSSVFMIPDFGESDVLHLNLPFKHILSESLKNRQWPLWTPYLSSGFPILAEGQMGTFYMPNLILFRFLPVILAYNFNLILSYIFIFTGTYLFIRSFYFSRITSLFAGIIFTFSGFFSVHLNHFNLLQTASLLPLLFWASRRLFLHPGMKNIILFAFIQSQQIFAGHFYIVFISLTGIYTFYFLLQIFTPGDKKIRHLLKRFLYLSTALSFSFILSAVQLLPTRELMQLSARSGGLDIDTVTSYPYPFRHLRTFFYPYAYGDPAKGTYPPISDEWGIFWENTAYVGILPLILAFFSFFSFRSKETRTGLMLLLFSILLAAGKYSPIYFLFSFPPFNYFRVPSKFLVLTAFSICFLASFTFEKIIKRIDKIGKLKYIIIIIIFLFLLADEYRFSYNYPPLSPSFWWTEIPQSALLLANEEGRITTIGAASDWNGIFIKNGWQDLNPYRHFRNSLYPNYNAMYSVSQTDINTGGLIPRRNSYLMGFTKNIQFDEIDLTASISAVARNALALSGSKYMITSYDINDRQFSKIKTVYPSPESNLHPIHVYRNEKVYPRSYISYQTQTVRSVEDIYKELNKEDFLIENKVLVEEDNILVPSKIKGKGFTRIVSQNSQFLEFEASTNVPGIFTVSDSNYPGWVAYLDGESVPVFYVNLVARGIRLPEGIHRISFRFESESFQKGKKITYISHFIIFPVLLLYFLTSHYRYFHNKRPFLYHGSKGHD